MVLNLEAVTPHTSLVSLDKVPAVRFALSRSRLDETVIPGLLGLRAGATRLQVVGVQGIHFLGCGVWGR